jgi:hypothetical protein
VLAHRQRATFWYCLKKQRLLQEYFDQLQCLADALMEHEQLNRAEFEALMQKQREGEVTRMKSQHNPDFLYTWRRALLERQTCEPEGDAVKFPRATGQEATSEAEALHRWLADGGDLDCAFLYGLEIIVGDETSGQFDAGKPRENCSAFSHLFYCG